MWYVMFVLLLSLLLYFSCTYNFINLIWLWWMHVFLYFISNYSFFEIFLEKRDSSESPCWFYPSQFLCIWRIKFKLWFFQPYTQPLEHFFGTPSLILQKCKLDRSRWISFTPKTYLFSKENGFQLLRHVITFLSWCSTVWCDPLYLN